MEVRRRRGQRHQLASAMGGIERGKPSLMVMARIAQALSAPLAKLISE
jgi:hypothetical protein